MWKATTRNAYSVKNHANSATLELQHPRGVYVQILEQTRAQQIIILVNTKHPSNRILLQIHIRKYCFLTSFPRSVTHIFFAFREKTYSSFLVPFQTWIQDARTFTHNTDHCLFYDSLPLNCLAIHFSLPRVGAFGNMSKVSRRLSMGLWRSQHDQRCGRKYISLILACMLCVSEL